MKMEDVIKAYLTLRNEKDAIEGEVKDRVKAIKEKMVKLEAYIKTVSYTHLTLPTNREV